MKTASRILGTAAFLDGWQAQDSPVYGAERRGAPMMAFVRISASLIRERGLIATPDLVVVADDTLLDEPSVRPLAGLAPDGGLLLATMHSEAEVRRHTGHAGPTVARDFHALTAEAGLGPAAASTALAAAASALLGLGPDALAEAVEQELESLGVGGAALERSLVLAERAREGLAPLPAPHPVEAPRPALVEIAYVPAEIGAPTITAPPGTPARRTGSWRTRRPEIALERCTRCWVCFLRCPDGAIALDDADLPHIDYDVCKGCMICVEECPTHGIAAVREVRPWGETPA
jgi:pyruvate ferredoxin oxidoreductase gamma subunit